MSGPDCVWCGMTIDAHREQGPAAKTPCGMLKRGFKPITQTSTGDVPAPTVEQTVYAIIAEACTKSEAAGAKHERAAVVKYLRAIAQDHWSNDFSGSLRALAGDIEKGEHLK